MSQSHAAEIESGERFSFGENWRLFLASLNEERIREAERSLCEMLQLSSLEGLRFLDVGCGSGLFSLAARRLGANVVSFDYDPASAACAHELRRRFFPEDPSWTVQEGSVLDQRFLASLDGPFDVVYSWGVLHHTGAMWRALASVEGLVRRPGRLFIALYHDTGGSARRWRAVKKAYNRLPPGLRFLVLWPSFAVLWGPPMLRDLVYLRPFHTWRHYGGTRGMSPWRDVVDWVGGYPYEVAKPEEVFAFYRDRGFALLNLRTVNGNGCDEYVFEAEPQPTPA